jgi:hypothetical protein
METGRRSAHGTAADERLVANPIARRVATEGSKRSRGQAAAVLLEIGRFRSCAVAQIKLDPDECFVAYEHS